MLVTQIPIENIDEFLFGDEWGGLPAKELFTIVQITHEEEDVDNDDEGKCTTGSSGEDN
jgi:hypothetical protein